MLGFHLDLEENRYEFANFCRVYDDRKSFDINGGKGLSTQVNIISWLLALVPILSLLVLIVKLRWGGSKAGPVGWFIAIVVAILFFGADLQIIAIGSLKGLWSTIYILYIIWGALALYNVVDIVKGFDTITRYMTAWTGGNRLIQLFTVGWAFPSFIQGVCGFGAPVAVSAPLLVGLGFNPVLAATTVLIAHAWSITFGSLGSSYGAIISIVDPDPKGLAFWSSTYLAITCVLGGIIITHLYKGWRTVLQSMPSILLLGLAMSGSFWLTVNYLTPYLGSLVGGIVGLVFGSWVLIRMPWNEKERSRVEPISTAEGTGMNFMVAASAYFFLVFIVFVVYMTPIKDALAWATVGLSFPETATGLGFVNKAVDLYSPINVLTTPGTLIFLSAFAAILFYISKGLWGKGFTGTVLTNLVKQANPTTITVISMCMMAMVMMEAGITAVLAQGVASATGSLYPVFAPLIGALGAFMTGSNTSSNILFAAFQRDVAVLLNIDHVVILSLQTAGGSIGCMFSPMKVALGTAVTGISGSEGVIIKKTLGYGIFLCLLVGILGILTLLYF